MASIEVVRPYIEQKIGELLGIDKVVRDGDGDIPIRAGSALYFARLLDGPTGPMLRVFSPMLGEVKKNGKLLERLNTINMTAPYVKFFWASDQVFCSMDLVAENLEVQEINNALGAVSWHADQLDDLLQKDFGGKRMFDDASAETSKPPTGSGENAAYL